MKTLEENEEYSKIGSEMMNKITEDDNDWTAWKILIETMINIYSKMENNNIADQLRQQLTLDGTPTCLDMLIKQIDDRAQNTRSRAPYLAKFELSNKLNKVPDSWESIENLITNYIDKFGGKQSTYFDLEPYLPMLSKEKAENIIQCLLNTQNTENDQNPDNVCCKHILPFLLKVYYIVYYSLVVKIFKSVIMD